MKEMEKEIEDNKFMIEKLTDWGVALEKRVKALEDLQSKVKEKKI